MHNDLELVEVQECPYCRKTVQKGKYCAECGKPLEEKFFFLGPTEFLILSVLVDNETMKVLYIIDEAMRRSSGEKSETTIRTTLYNLLRQGLVSSPIRGIYTITENGIASYEYSKKHGRERVL